MKEKKVLYKIDGLYWKKSEFEKAILSHALKAE